MATALTVTTSRWRRLLCSLFLVAAFVAAVGALASSLANQGGSTSPKALANLAGGANLGGKAALSGQRVGDNAFHQKIARWVIEHTTNGQQAAFFVVLVDQADLSQAAAFKTKAEKGHYVYNSLLNKSQTTQGPVLQWLRERGIEHRSFYIVNAILVKGPRDIAETLAARPDVARIEGNPLIDNHLPRPVNAPAYLERPTTIEPGVAYTHAPDVWALGYTGQSIVIGSEDTGVRWTHNALKPHYRGWDGQNANHDYNWHDAIHDSVGNPCGNDSRFPCDDNGHGSHTTGTAVGDDGMGNQIGMAPGANWIGCRALSQGFGSPARYIECMEWFIAPYPIGGGQGDPTKAPDVTINSWYCDPPEGCSTDTLRAAVEAEVAAGIMTVVAAQNFGPNCSTVGYPPGIYEAAYTVGALITGADNIAGFSSRGPVTVDGSNRIKPDITAPGTATRSCSNISDNSYTALFGTSQATPHVSGAMALLWSAIPSLKNQIDASRAALNNAAHFISSTDCGDAGPPNNVYGWGRLDILAAVGDPTPSPTPTPTATPTSTCTPAPTPCQTWMEESTHVPYSAGGMFAVSDGTFVYAGGGLDLSSNTFHNDLLQYNPSTDTWDDLPHSPDQHAVSQAVYFNGEIYNMGGFGPDVQLTDTTRIYDVITKTWSTGAPMPQALADMATMLWNGVIYIAGGFNGAWVDTLYAYDIASNTWITTLTSVPQPLNFPGFGAIDGKLYIAGGFNGSDFLDTLYIYDIATNTWTTGANLPQAVAAPGSTVFNGLLYLYGGSFADLTLTNMTFIYDPCADTWSLGPNMNVSRGFLYGTSVGDHLVVAPGGADNNINGFDNNEQLITTACGTPTPTATATPTSTPTATARPSPIPRPRPTPRPRL
jgi:subtilisin family serine protease